MTIWRMRTAYWILKATHIHSEYAILIPFPLQQWLNERASMLRFTYVASLVRFAQWHNSLLFVIGAIAQFTSIRDWCHRTETRAVSRTNGEING